MAAADLKCVIKAEFTTRLLQVFFMAIFAFILGLPMLKSYVAFSAVVSWVDVVWPSSGLSVPFELMLMASCGVCVLG